MLQTWEGYRRNGGYLSDAAETSTTPAEVRTQMVALTQQVQALIRLVTPIETEE